MNKPVTQKHCAILTMDNLDGYESYEHLLVPIFAANGWQCHFISWHDETVNWDNFDVVIIRTTWDYQKMPEKFLQVLNNIENSSAHLENSLSLVRWNIHKHYLKELEQKNVPMVPTHWYNSFTAEQLDKAFTDFNCSALVIKPCISAGALNTFWLTQDNYQALIPQLTDIFKQRDFMLQPFVPSIIAEGEYSVFYFNGVYSHTILKKPKAKDFRVQEEHGGQLSLINASDSLKNIANNALLQLPEIPLYARLDFVNYQQQFVLMEAELIEPSLYFNFDESAPARFVDAFLTRMAHLAL